MHKNRFCENIKKSVNKFNLNLSGKIVLTEAASGNYACTSISAALSGAEVLAYVKSSKYGSKDEVIEHTLSLLKVLGCEEKVTFIESLDDINISNVDILTNTGFLRPITEDIINKLDSKCVIPLMWEPWEFRKEDIHLDSCIKKGIKVYGTNEDDVKVNTKHYIGYTILKFLLERKMTPFTSKVLILGNKEFKFGISTVLKNNLYDFDYVSDYSKILCIDDYTAIVLCDVTDDTLLIGNSAAKINVNDISIETFVLHIAGHVDFNGATFYYSPQHPRDFPYMSYTTDYIDPLAVIDLHTAALKVSEGMIVANNLKLKGIDYKKYLESNYPALSFNNQKLW